jgi:hypothetical protein
MAWAGFLGAWLLVAGPLYQGAIELHEADVDRDAMEAARSGIGRPEPVSPWWWLLPPVMYLIRRRRRQAYRQAALALLTPAQREQVSSFINKASAWFTVATGATLLAADQTWRLTERSEWPSWVFWLLVVVMLAGSVLNTALRMSRDEEQERPDAIVTEGQEGRGAAAPGAERA